MKTKIFLIVVTAVIINSCAVTKKSQRGFKFSGQGGINHGGITENTDLSIVSNSQATPESTVDAYSGATISGYNVGAHVNKPLRYGEIETGLNFMYNYQIFSYADQGNMFIGVRKLDVNQLMIPFTYNLVLFKKLMPDTDIQLKFGVLVQNNRIHLSDAGLTFLPDYSINKWSNGVTIGISAYPVKFANGTKLGFYLDAYRGSRIYTDYYNQEGFEMPGSSFVKFGVRYQFKQLNMHLKSESFEFI